MNRTPMDTVQGDGLGVGGLVVWHLSVFICVNLCSFFPLLNLFANRDIYINRTPIHTDAHGWILRVDFILMLVSLL